jgi:ADP-dependent NAD(P)H-hydrate dehydratase
VKRGRELTRTALRAFPLPAQGEGGKDGNGRLLVVAGSRETPGSALLCAQAAFRSGAGRVRIATIAAVAGHLAMQVPEALVIPLEEARDGGCTRASIAEIADRACSADAIVAGPGMVRGRVAGALAAALLAARAPLVIDAALLHVLAPLAADCRGARLPPVLLPHAREMASLLGCHQKDVERDPLAAARAAAELYGAVVVAKGAKSHVAAPDGRTWTFKGGAPGLGVAGSGDALAGIVGGQLARGAEPLTALLWGVLLHGEAGAALARKVGPVGFLAREIADEIPALLAR